MTQKSLMPLYCKSRCSVFGDRLRLQR